MLAEPALADRPVADAESMRRRRHAFSPSPGCAVWPPGLPDPFPGFSGVPEIPASEFGAAVLGGAILHHGCLLVRGLIGPVGARRLTEALDMAFEGAAAYRLDRNAARGPAFTPFPLEPADELTEAARVFAFAGGGVWTADSPRAFEALLEELRRAGVPQAVESYLGETAYLSVGKSTLRRVTPASGTGWHQDGAFLGPEIRTVNCWLSLSACGSDAPGLDLFPRRAPGLYETGTRGTPFSWAVGDGVVQELEAQTGVRVVSPTFEAGDALLFDQLLLHRTGVRPGMTRDRLAIESWLFAGSTFPMKQIPLAL